MAKVKNQTSKAPTRLDAKHKLPGFKLKGDTAVFEIGALEQLRELKECLGTDNEDLASVLLTHMCWASFAPTGSNPADLANGMLEIMRGIAPKDPAESMLAVQMLGIHQLLVRSIYRSNLKDQTPEGIDANINRSVKLARTYTAQLEALRNYRNKGSQRIKVEHVTVNDGGQAVVGDVHHQGGGDSG